MILIKTGLIALFIMLFLLKSLLEWTLLPQIMAGAALMVFCISIRELKSLTRNMIGLLLVASAVLIGTGTGQLDWSQAVIANSGIVALLMTAPMMGTILYYAPYEKIIASLANQYIRTNSQFYALTMVLVTLLCPVMNLASVPFAYQLLAPIAAQYRPAVFYRALMLGFCANVFGRQIWDPWPLCCNMYRFPGRNWRRSAWVLPCLVWWLLDWKVFIAFPTEKSVMLGWKRLLKQGASLQSTHKAFDTS
ncbi:MAG: hypothetical protein AB9917_19535 [Negativicutes bacterium]